MSEQELELDYANPDEFEDGPIEDYGDEDARPNNGR